MRIIGKNKKMNIGKKSFFLLLPLFILTACTGKDDIVLELNRQEALAGQEIGGQEASLEDRVLQDNEEGLRERAETGSIMEGENAVSIAIPAPEENVSGEIYVHICGAVEEPGVYKLAAGSRIFEGVEAAGGFREDACEDFINLALLLQDGQRLVIPTTEEADAARADEAYKEQWLSDAGATGPSTVLPEGAGVAKEAASGKGALVNINTATEDELSGIEGIGAGKAAAIVRYRQENGAFTVIEDIMKVSGIKEGTFEKIKGKITVN